MYFEVKQKSRLSTLHYLKGVRLVKFIELFSRRARLSLHTSK